MPSELVPSDVAILDLLRKRDRMSVSELTVAMEVTSTAIRQRLSRLRAQGFIDRQVAKLGRGRPAHRYSLTQEGRRKTGANFADLAIALWHEIHSIQDIEIRRGLLDRISRRLVDAYADQIHGDTLREKMDWLCTLFGARGVPLAVETPLGELPVLTVLACPYPELAEQDRDVCTMERKVFSELLGQDMRLTGCQLDGATCCTFEQN